MHGLLLPPCLFFSFHPSFLHWLAARTAGGGSAAFANRTGFSVFTSRRGGGEAAVLYGVASWLYKLRFLLPGKGRRRPACGAIQMCLAANHERSIVAPPRHHPPSWIDCGRPELRCPAEFPLTGACDVSTWHVFDQNDQ